MATSAKPSGKAIHMTVGFVGQVGAREASTIFVDMIRQKRTAGRVLPLADPPGDRSFSEQTERVQPVVIGQAVEQVIIERIYSWPEISTRLGAAGRHRTSAIKTALSEEPKGQQFATAPADTLMLTMKGARCLERESMIWMVASRISCRKSPPEGTGFEDGE
ncbi:hypothetical protein H6P81_018329 [Aristolochia fimbriata]|uniref:TIP49 P-loop domain-containing protein n=1 Tax=Aristolochia fimbriata TaxID=158543 RepID=A0AAV7E0T3_ARIFI|nr:hypothetical protein H6P81_018329 [Aristolochia fimbriata]